MNKKEAKEIVLYEDLDSTIKYLLDAQSKGENVYIDYGSSNGVVRLYSSDITVDGAYQRIYGLTKSEKEEYDKELETSENKEPVIKKYNYMKEVYIDKLRDDATKIVLDGVSLDTVIKALSEFKKIGESVYIDFKSTEDDEPIRLFSVDLDVDRAYLKVMGITKAQYDENKERFKLADSDEELQMVITDLYQLVEENKKR